MADDDNKDTDDVKRKFREALERKNRSAKEGEAHENFTSNVQDTRPAPRKRQFRRKTG